MSKQTKQTRKLNGKLSLMVMATLFLTALPLINVEAGNNTTPEKQSAIPQFRNDMSAYDAFIELEPWMLIHTDWNKSDKIYVTDYYVNVEAWMLAPENWEYSLAETTDTKLNRVYGWMFDPAGWGNDLAGLSHQSAYFDLVVPPFYF
jgi:hypothetical protein